MTDLPILQQTKGACCAAMRKAVSCIPYIHYITLMTWPAVVRNPPVTEVQTMEEEQANTNTGLASPCHAMPCHAAVSSTVHHHHS